MLLLFSKKYDPYDEEERSIFYKLSLLVIDFYILNFLSLMILNFKIYTVYKKVKLSDSLSDYLLPNSKFYMKGSDGLYLKIFLYVVFSYVVLLIVKKICQKILN